MIQLQIPINQGTNRAATHAYIYERQIIISSSSISFKLCFGTLDEAGNFKINKNIESTTDFYKSITIEGLDMLTLVTDYPITIKGKATGGTVNTLEDITANFGNLLNRQIVIVRSDGNSEEKKIISNTATIITVDSNWTIIPDNTVIYFIIQNHYDIVANGLYQYCLDKGIEQGVLT